jgi:hypothetical protein
VGGRVALEDEGTGADAQPPDLPRRRFRRWAISGIAVLCVVWAALAAGKVVAAYHADQNGIAALDQVRGQMAPDELTSDRARHQLDSAEQEFASAHDSLSSWLLAPVTIVPVAGRQLRSLQDLSSAAGEVASIGTTFLSQVHAVVNSPHGAGPERISALRRLSALSSAAVHQLDRIETGPSVALVAPLASRREAFVSQLDGARQRLVRAAQVSTVAADILEGPQTYLVMAANNAEMRAGSGMFLDVGTATTGGGSVHLGQLVLSAGLLLPPGAVTATGDLERNWGWLAPGQDWRNLGLTPRFEVTAPLAAQMWQADTGQHVDGVIALDVAGLQELLRVTGPVTAAGVTVSADNVVTYIEHDEYSGLSDQAIQSAGRQSALGAIASAVLDHLQGQSVDLTTLGKAMAAATQGRHLLLWSDAAPAEAAWQASGVAGTLTGTSLAATVISRGGNKLDQYLSAEVRMRRSSVGPDTAVTMTVHLHNGTPDGESQFIAGPYPGLGASYGEYLGLVSVNLPAAATHRSMSGAGSLAVDGTDGPTWVLASTVDVPRGGSRDVTVRFDLPGHHGSVTVEPSARVPPMRWQAQGQMFDDARPTTLSW